MNIGKEKFKTKKSIPFIFQIFIILFVGAAVSGFLYGTIKLYRLHEYEKNIVKHTVTFVDQYRDVIEVKQVENGFGVSPPNFETKGVFRGWNGVINDVHLDIEVSPIVYSSIEENLFCFDSVYVKEGEEFTVDFKLIGEVNICYADLKIQFDPEVMTFISVIDCNSCKIVENEDGELKLSLNGDSSLTEETILAKVVFKALKKDVYSSQINLFCNNGELSNGKSVTVSTINNKIFYLQEVK